MLLRQTIQTQTYINDMIQLDFVSKDDTEQGYRPGGVNSRLEWATAFSVSFNRVMLDRSQIVCRLNSTMNSFHQALINMKYNIRILSHLYISYTQHSSLILVLLNGMIKLRQLNMFGSSSGNDGLNWSEVRVEYQFHNFCEA